MKRLTLIVMLSAAVAVSAWFARDPQALNEQLALANSAGGFVWEKIETNPVPVLLALGGFVLTVAYHKAKGRSLRESVAVAATRVAVVPAPSCDVLEENPVIRRAKARAVRAQLIADQINLQNRQRKLPEEVLKAEKETCYTEQALIEAQRVLAARRKAHEEAVAKLDSLRKQQTAGEAELAQIEAELEKLANLV